MRYRPLGESTWILGVTENISRTGVLLRTGQLLPLNTPMEIQFFLSSSDLSSEGGVICDGKVARTASELGQPAGIGATVVPRKKKAPAN